MIGNNNPFNIRYSKRNHWQGQIGQMRGFCEFEDLKFGIRACFVLLQNYIRKGIDTPRKIINRFAPPVENPTGSYIRFVCFRALIVNPDISNRDVYDDITGESINVDFPPLCPDLEVITYKQLFMLMSRMAWFESGSRFSACDIQHYLSFDEKVINSRIKM